MSTRILAGIPVSALFIMVWVVPVAAQQTEPVRMDFRRALEEAYEHNPRMVEARQLIKVAQGDLITARTFENPEVELEFAQNNSGLGSFEVKQPLDPIGVRFLKSKMAANDVKISEESLKSVWSYVYLQIKETYSQIILRKKQLELAENNVDAMRQFFGRVQVNYQSGAALKNDFQRAKIELLKAENDLISAQKELKTVKARLNLLLGHALETDFAVQENLKEEQLTITYEKLKSLALANRPDLKIAQLQLDSNQKNLVKEQLSRLPSYSVGFRRMDEAAGDDYAIIVGVEIPFWNFNQGEIKKAQAQEDAQKVRVDTAKNEASYEVYEAFLTTQLRQKQLDLSKQSLEEANELFRLANLRYEEGKIDFLNYLDQVKTAVQARVAYFEALFDLSQSLSILETAVYSSLRQEEDFLR